MKLKSILLFFILLTLVGCLKKPSMDMVRIEGGKFHMGKPDNHNSSTTNVIGVFLADGVDRLVAVKSFYLSKYEVTKGEYSRFVRETGYRPIAERAGSVDLLVNGFSLIKKVDWRDPGFSQGENEPVVCVTLIDAVEFCNWRSKKEGLRPYYVNNGEFYDLVPSANGYRLPTEAEWEYAARNGGKFKISFGCDWQGRGKPWENIGDEAFGRAHPAYSDFVKGYDDGFAYTSPVGRTASNPLGLYDMIGNVAEWTWSNFDDLREPLNLERDGFTAVKGGSWFRPVSLGKRSLMPYCRLKIHPFCPFNDLGFRVARNGE